MKTVLSIAIALFWSYLSSPLFAAEEPPSDRAAVLAQAERDFAALSVSEGMKPAFMEFLADSGIVFRPHPVNGKRATADRPNPKITLDWVPAFADVASDEDLGYTTGPWIVTDRSGQNRPPVYGTYLSVWKKQPDNEWKVVLDIGTSGPPYVGALKDVRTAFPMQANDVKKEANRGLQVLLTLDRGFSQREGTTKAYLSYAAKDIRLIREGEFPVAGSDSASTYLSNLQARVSFDPIAGDLSSAGDLGYTYGTYQLHRGADEEEGTETGYYVHIWKKQQDSSFKLVVDLLTPVPEE